MCNQTHQFITPKLLLVAVCFLFAIGSAETANSQGLYQLEIYAGDTGACPGTQNVAVPIYLRNYTDTVAGFGLLLQLSGPDIGRFQTHYEEYIFSVYFIYTEWDNGNPAVPTDSIVASAYWVCNQWDGDVCIDSSSVLGYCKCNESNGLGCIDSTFIQWNEAIGSVYADTLGYNMVDFDTSGTLLSGWEYIFVRALDGNGYSVSIEAYADQNGSPPDTVTPGIGFPQTGLKPLIKLKAEIFDIDDAVTDRETEIMVDYWSPYLFFTDGHGEDLCSYPVESIDTTYFMCAEWLIPGEACMWWERVYEEQCPPEGCDSINIDTNIVSMMDVPRCCNPDGSECDIYAQEWECADMYGGTGVWYDGCIRVLNGSLSARICYGCGDMNGDGLFNVLDVIAFINYTYKGGPAFPGIYQADIDGNGALNILDIICLINSIYKGKECGDCGWLP